MPQFYKTPIHYLSGRQIFTSATVPRTIVTEVSDNDYRTFATGTDYYIQTHGTTSSTPTRIDAVCVKGSGISSYSVSASAGYGGGIEGRSVPTTVTTPEGTSVNTNVNGITTDLVDLAANQVTVVDAQSLTGTTATVANDLTSVDAIRRLTVTLSAATLTADATPGTVELVGVSADGLTTVRNTLSFASTALTAPQSTADGYRSVTEVNLTGFSAGTLTITNEGALNATEALVTVTGTDLRIYEIMLLESIIEMDDERFFTDISPSYQDNSILRSNIRGSNFRIRSLASRGKWSVQYRALFDSHSNVTHAEFMEMLHNNDNFVFAQQYRRYPDRIYPATWGADVLPQRFLTRRVSSGIVVEFNVQEM